MIITSEKKYHHKNVYAALFHTQGTNISRIHFMKNPTLVSAV